MELGLLFHGIREGFARHFRFGNGGMPAVLEPAHVGQGSLRMAAHGNELGDDGDGDFFRRNGANVEPDGRMDAVKELQGRDLRA